MTVWRIMMDKHWSVKMRWKSIGDFSIPPSVCRSAVHAGFGNRLGACEALLFFLHFWVYRSPLVSTRCSFWNSLGSKVTSLSTPTWARYLFICRHAQCILWELCIESNCIYFCIYTYRYILKDIIWRSNMPLNLFSGFELRLYSWFWLLEQEVQLIPNLRLSVEIHILLM